ncbi:unnamed protein product [Pleuronectes platessa]|uniref:Uncharacterized protein n=1 Tax=Pleuronectes platessa TaxID=8262 RepID=A0A9N7UPK1_PLEPL|nr:unnamed protein product [Pleuronectes platessa]
MQMNSCHLVVDGCRDGLTGPTWKSRRMEGTRRRGDDWDPRDIAPPLAGPAPNFQDTLGLRLKSDDTGTTGNYQSLSERRRGEFTRERDEDRQRDGEREETDPASLHPSRRRLINISSSAPLFLRAAHQSCGSTALQSLTASILGGDVLFKVAQDKVVSPLNVCGDGGVACQSEVSSGRRTDESQSPDEDVSISGGGQKVN